MLSQKQKELANQRLSEFLLEHFGETIQSASNIQLYRALAEVSLKYLHANRSKTFNDANKNKKTVHYMSIEFLIGRNLRNNLWNLGLDNYYTELLAENGKNITDIYRIEKDAGLGNGGLGRLAACFLDSLAKLGYPAFGHSIRYEYGLFNQKIVDGRQIETPDEWLDTGNVWLEPREDEAIDVAFGGTLEQHYEDHKLGYRTIGAKIIRGVPYDMLVSGYNSNTVSTLRLWSAQAKNKFDIKIHFGVIFQLIVKTITSFFKNGIIRFFFFYPFFFRSISFVMVLGIFCTYGSVSLKQITNTFNISFIFTSYRKA